MSEQTIIKTEAQLREAIHALWAEDATLNWRWKEWQPRHERGLDAIGELALDKRRITFGVEFRLNPAARDVEFLAKQKYSHPLLLIAPNISATLARLCRLLTKSPAVETVSKPLPQVTIPAQIVSSPDAVPAAPHA